MTKKEAALKIIEQDGSCVRILCGQCPLFSDKAGYTCEDFIKKYKKTSLVQQATKQFCIDYLNLGTQMEFEF